MRVSIIKDNVLILLLGVAYASIFCYVCIDYITPVYSYANFSFVYDAKSYFFFLLCSLLMSMLIVIQKGYTQRFFIGALYVMSIIPFMCLYFCGLGYSEYGEFFQRGIAAYIILAVITAALGRFRLVRLYQDNYFLDIKVNTVIMVLSIITMFTILRYVVLNGVDIFNLNILKVYETRLLLRETMGGLLAYVDNWSIKVFNPLCILLSMHTKKYRAAIFFVVLQIILFGFSSHKIALFIVAILLTFYYNAHRFLLKTRSMLLVASLGSLAIAFSNSGLLLSLWRRALLVPSQLNYYFFDYFSRNEFDWFAKSFLRYFAVSRYDMPLPRIIGAEFFNNAATNANTGFLGAGYAQGGMIIVVIYAIIIGVTINVIDSYTRRISPKIVIGITLLPMLTAFISSDLPTNFLTGGILITLMLLSILSHCKDRERLM